ncbi:MarR family winged helix-turn-helix transcriptional regulator [Microbaculum marinum]|uniref:MarR family winged helix-turn-helix transcriptional regulator n=1 Tax=Microbaculum marinum TaxID=1764581 RepID=A0AAW9RMY6_9HYPH
MRRTTRAISQTYDRILAPAGLTGTQFSILATLSLSGPIPINPLARRLGMDRTSLSRTLRPLVHEELIQEAGSRDRRERPIVLTDKGRKSLQTAWPLWEAAQQTAVSVLGSEEARALLARLNALEEALRAAR